MHYSTIAVSLLASLAAASPLAKRADRGSYTVGGLGARKSAIRAAGGDSLDLAIAMLETDNMGTDYTYGDGKSGDSANFGVFKQNWFMLYTCSSVFSGQGSGDWKNGAKLNGDLNADVKSRHDCYNHYGPDAWFSGHRNGQSGVENPNTSDIQKYRSAIDWIKSQIDSNSGALTNDVRYWVDVNAI